jgi:hypothetical protein
LEISLTARQSASIVLAPMRLKCLQFGECHLDWVEVGTFGYGAKKGDGHGIYISNGSDWNIVRFNQTSGGASSDFQINADPASTCKEVGIAFDDSRCDAYAGEGEGGQGASDYFLVDSNFFHHSNGRRELHRRAPKHSAQQYFRAGRRSPQHLFLARDRQSGTWVRGQQDPE